MHPQHTAVFTLTLVTIMCSTAARSAEPTQSAAVSSTGSAETPRVLKLLGLCSVNDQAFCLNGKCLYHTDLNRPTCSCPQNFSGERCENMQLDSHSDINREELIAIGGGVTLVLCSIIAALYCCLKKRCEREKPYQICNSALAI